VLLPWRADDYLAVPALLAKQAKCHLNKMAITALEPACEKKFLFKINTFWGASSIDEEKSDLAHGLTVGTWHYSPSSVTIDNLALDAR
jgi:hypothetical protein